MGGHGLLFVFALGEKATWRLLATGPVSNPILGRPTAVAAAGGYRGSPLSVEGTPHLAHAPHAGSRLPDATVTAGGSQVHLHDLIARPGVHVLLRRDADAIERLSFGPHVSLHRLTSEPGDGLVAVRPDGCVGFRCRTADLSQLWAWLARGGAC